MMCGNTRSQGNVMCIIFSHAYEVLIFLYQENHIWEQQMTQSMLDNYCSQTLQHRT